MPTYNVASEFLGEDAVLRDGTIRRCQPHSFVLGIEVVVSSRRTLILVGALVTGAIAALLIFKYVGGIEEKAQGDAQMVSVVIAKGDIKKGDGATDLIARQVLAVGERRQIDLPANVVTRTDELKSQVAQLDIAPGTVIVSSMFQSDAAITDTVSTALSPGMVATTVSADQVHAVAGFVAQGDYVNLTVIGSCKLGDGGKLQLDGGGVAGGSGGGDTSSATASGPAASTVSCAASLYQKARILGIGQSLGTGASSPVAAPGDTTPTTAAPTSDLITFELPPEAAQRLQLASNVYMSLVRKDYQPKPIPIDPYLVVDGVNGATPYGADPETQTAGG